MPAPEPEPGRAEKLTRKAEPVQCAATNNQLRQLVLLQPQRPLGKRARGPPKALQRPGRQPEVLRQPEPGRQPVTLESWMRSNR